MPATKEERTCKFCKHVVGFKRKPSAEPGGKPTMYVGWSVVQGKRGSGWEDASGHEAVCPKCGRCQLCGSEAPAEKEQGQ